MTRSVTHAWPAGLLLITFGWATADAAAVAEPLAARATAALAVVRGRTGVPGLQAPVRVQRDRWGVPHIYAQNQHDLFYAQGYVVAQDRLFQMEIWKRSGQGRLAEILGPEALQRDINARRLRYRGDLRAEYRSYAPDARQILEAFTAGINAYIDTLDVPGGPRMPLEFQLAGFAPEHWHPQDCLNRLAAFSMTSNAASELLNAELLSRLGAARATGLMDFDPPVTLDPVHGQDYSGLGPKLLKDIVGSDSRNEFRPQPLHESNNWTISGTMTADGKPLLANDPHRVIAEPSLRYIVHLVAPGWNVIGAGEPGLPGVAAGHNQNIAWGFTIFGLDQQDLYLEQLDPADPGRYATGDGWQRLHVQKEVIRVRGAAPVAVELQYTRHGPVLWHDGTRALALRWVGAEPGGAGYLGSLALDRAQNWQQFEAAMPRWKVPSENIVYADRLGNIGEHSTGLAPIRRTWTGLLPVPGNGGYEWDGFVPNQDLPHSYNPAAGFVATANHKMIPDHYGYAVGFEWASPVRFLRVQELIEQAKATGRKLTVADMEAFQTDVVSLHARALQKILRSALADPARTASERNDPAAKLLLDWDCELGAGSAPAALYEVWMRELRIALTPLVVPEEARLPFGGLDEQRTLTELAGARVEVFGADAPAARDRTLIEALGRAQGLLAAEQGPDMARWSWGAMHPVWFRHPLDRLEGAEALFDRGPVPRSGDGNVLQATGVEGDSFAQRSGASYREIFDLGDWDRARVINAPGQSGQPASPHYDDLLPLWREGKYFPLVYTKPAVDRETTDTLELTPAARH